MGILSKGLLGDLFGEVAGVVKHVLPSPEARRAFELQLSEIQDRHEARLHEQLLAQSSVNKTEAAHANIFVAGWRPFIGWICGVGLAVQFVLLPLASIIGLNTSNVQLETEQLMMLVLAMLGLAVPRTFEAIKGVARQTFGKKTKSEAVAEVEETAAQSENPTDEEDGPWNKVK